jgi:hypothetical protein
LWPQSHTRPTAQEVTGAHRRGATIIELEERLDLPSDIVDAAVRQLAEMTLVLRSSDRILALPLHWTAPPVMLPDNPTERVEGGGVLRASQVG